MNKPNSLSSIRIVLSCTSHPGNIGAAARAMKTMGLSQLYLVRPRSFPDAQATAMASGADDVLQQAVVCDSLDQALSDVRLTVAMTARLRDISAPVKPPREAAERVMALAQQQQPVALLFGAETSGLTNEELSRAQLLVNIPASADYASLNLAAAVQILCYELRLALLNTQPQAALLPVAELATHQQLEGFYQHLEQMLHEIGFFTTKNPTRLMQRLRRLFARAALEADEVNILRGILTVSTAWNARLKARYQTKNGE